MKASATASPAAMRRSFMLALAVVVVLMAVGCGGSSSQNRQAKHAGGSATCRLRGPHTERVNVSSSGRQANNVTTRGETMSADGRFVVFSSIATNLVPGDTNGVEDVFVRDLRFGRTVRVSVSSSGAEANGPSYFPLLSSDGRLVFFRSLASDLVPGERARTEALFVHDTRSGVTRRVPLGWTRELKNRLPRSATEHAGCRRWCANAVDAKGTELIFTARILHRVGDSWHRERDVLVRLPRRTIDLTAGRRGLANGPSDASSISADGRLVAFRSFASNLVAHDTNGRPDVFVRNLVNGATERVDVSSAGAQANGGAFRGMLSGDGRFVGFRSQASNLVAGDTNRAVDVFVHDRLTGRTSRVSVSSAGAQARGEGLPWHVRQTTFMSRPFLSEHGRYAAFTSRAPNLVGGDTNRLRDVFVRDRTQRTTVRVSIGNHGEQANGGSRITGMSANGRVVGFMSFASNLVQGDTNGRRDYFVRVLRPELVCTSSAAHSDIR